MGKNEKRLPWVFYGYYFAMFMGMAIFNSFFAAFFTRAGMSSVQLGLLFGLAPLAGLLFQPIWGNLADRAKTKNRILMSAIGGVMFSVLVFYGIGMFFHGTQSGRLILLSAAMILFTVFNNALVPLQDTITLDYIVRNGGQYGPARMSGTLGYAFMALVAGLLLTRFPNSVFIIYFIVLCIIMLAASRLPKAQGYRERDEKGSVFEVLRDKEILLLLLLVLVQYIALSFGHTFLGPYMLSLGGNDAMIGIANMVQALTEIPFHIRWGRKLMKKFGVHKCLIFSAFVGALRWFLTAISRSPLLLIIATGLEGVMLVPMIVLVVEFINERMPKRLKATGQTAITLFSVVLPRTIGNIGGGALVGLFNKMGYQGTSLSYGLLVPLSLLSVFALGIPLLRAKKKREQKEAESAI